MGAGTHHRIDMVGTLAAAITLELAFMLFTSSTDCSDKITTAIGQGALFVTFIASQLFQLKREARNRQWAKEDAEETAAKLASKTEQTVAKLAKKTEDVAADVKSATVDALAQHETTVTAKLDEKLEAQTTELQRSMRTRVTDLNANLDKLTTDGPKRRKTDE
jgi:hypothetical protein